jgi:hippurate hydrolase
MAQFIMAIQTIVSRNVSPLETAVISVGSVHGGSPLSSNVMPSEVELTGTMRCFSKATQEIVTTRMQALADSVAAGVGCSADVSLRWGFRVVINHDENTDVAVAAAQEVGSGAVDTQLTPTTGGEDFGFMLEQRPGSFIFIGNGVNADGTGHAVHTPHYDFNDDIIPIGVEYWVSLVAQELNLAG